LKKKAVVIDTDKTVVIRRRIKEWSSGEISSAALKGSSARSINAFSSLNVFYNDI
jgi:hypothetical protein